MPALTHLNGFLLLASCLEWQGYTEKENTFAKTSSCTKTWTSWNTMKYHIVYLYYPYLYLWNGPTKSGEEMAPYRCTIVFIYCIWIIGDIFSIIELSPMIVFLISLLIYFIIFSFFSINIWYVFRIFFFLARQRVARFRMSKGSGRTAASRLFKL